MSRKYSFFCDGCGKDFGNDTHLNIKNSQAYISHFDNELKNWKQYALRCGSSELHFCDVSCLSNYLKSHIKTVEEKIMKGGC